MANAHLVGGGIRGSYRKRPRPGKKLKTIGRRNRKDVQIRHVEPNGRVVSAENITSMLRGLMADETRPWTEMAEETKKLGVKSPSTISSLYYGDTQLPAFRTQVAMLQLYGYQMKITRRAN